MNPPTRRQFLARSGLGASALLLGRRAARPDAVERPRAPFKILYSNDTTNITSCVSPYHQRGEPISDDRLRATIDEAKGVDVHMLQPGLGWIPWWKSDVYPAEDHYRYHQEKYGIRPNSFGRYMLDGGDLVGAFVEHCRRVGVVPFVSYRLNDGHHVRELQEALKRGWPTQNMSRFYWENYRKYRLGPDPTDWAQGVFNWAFEEVRRNKFALIEELCRKYDFAGLELDFMRHPHFFRPEETASRRRAIMLEFVGRVRAVLDRTARRGEHRWLCARVPALIEACDEPGIDLGGFAAAGVDMLNLSSSYFTCQATDLEQIRKLVPRVPLYLEMTHTPMTGKALAGSGTQVYQRTTDEQFYTTAHLAYEQGADGVSLFNFVYYREHQLPELGPFCEPPFQVLERLGDRPWLARQPQWYFLAAIRNKPRDPARRLQATIEAGAGREFLLEMAPTEHQKNAGLLRLRAEGSIAGRRWRVAVNGVPLEPAAAVRKPIEHPHEGFLGQAEQYAAFACPRSAVRRGGNTIRVEFDGGEPIKLIWIDVVLP